MTAMHQRLAELRRVLHDLRAQDATPAEWSMALEYINGHLAPMTLTLVDRERLVALEEVAQAALQHHFLGWSDGEEARHANQDLWEVCVRRQDKLADLAPRDTKGENPQHDDLNAEPCPTVEVNWVGLRVAFSARPGVSGQRGGVGWVVVAVGERVLVRLYCEGALSHEFWAEPGARWRPSDPQALRYVVRAPVLD